MVELIFPAALHGSAIEHISSLAEKIKTEKKSKVFPIKSLIGLTSGNVREIKGSSVRFHIDLDKEIKDSKVINHGIYVISLKWIRNQNNSSSTNSASSTDPGTSSEDKVVGICAVPEPENVGANRCEAVLFSTLNSFVMPDGKKRCLAEDGILKTIYGSSNILNNLSNIESNNKYPPINGNIELVFVDRLCDFSYIAVGPWLRDQILRHSDDVSSKYSKIDTDLRADSGNKSEYIASDNFSKHVDSVKSDFEMLIPRPKNIPPDDFFDINPDRPHNSQKQHSEIEHEGKLDPAYAVRTGGLGSVDIGD